MPASTLATRIALPAGLFALAGVGALSLALVRAQRAAAMEEAILGSDGIGETILLALDHEMRVNERDALRDMLLEVGKHEAIERVRLFNKQGWISFSSDSADVGQRVDLEAEACVTCHQGPEPVAAVAQDQRSRIFENAAGERLLGTIQVIPNREGCQGSDCHEPVDSLQILGVLDVAVSLEPVEARLTAAGWSAFIYALLAAGMITGGLFLMISWSVRRPLETVAQATRRVAEGTGRMELPQGTAPEVEILARSVNEVVENLSSSRSQLEQWAGRLEDRVAEKAQELADARFQIVQAEKLSSVGLVAAGIAHELNSPLMAIITYAHLVRRRLKDDPEGQEDVGMIEKEANRCAAIIRQLLDYSREQRRESRSNPCSVRQAVQGALDLLRVELQNGGVHVEAHIPDGLPDVPGDDVQLMQVFVNLFLNALHAMPDGGRLRVSGHAVRRADVPVVDLPPAGPDRLVRVDVADTGTGIEPDALPKVFDPFFTTKDVGKGSGLGLSVSLGIARKYGGTMLVESTPGEGTKFTLLLPVHQTSPER